MSWNVLLAVLLVVAGCEQDTIVCDGVRVFPLVDRDHCGACEYACGPVEQCINGFCVCVGSTSDPLNCGTCGNVCQPGAVCAEGRCACPVGTTDCGDACSSLEDDVRCGACDRACPSTGTCTDGVCACLDSAFACGLTSPQCGCPDGQGCYAASSGAIECQDAGETGDGSICEQPSDCAPGLQCVSVGSQTRCLIACASNDDCPGERVCLTERTVRPGLAIGVCASECDLVTHEGCEAPTQCIAVRLGGFALAARCTSEPALREGDTCDTATSICTGGICLDYDFVPPACERWCYTSANCRATETCAGTSFTYRGTALGTCLSSGF